MSDENNTSQIRADWYAKAKDQTLETLPAFLKELAEHPHDYNTICYALSAGAVATCWALDRTPNGGITGFQAGAIMWEFMEAWNHVTAPAWLQRGENMLFPQYADKFTTISRETWDWLKKEAAERLEKLSDDSLVSPGVIEHWVRIRDGAVPFGLQVRDER